MSRTRRGASARPGRPRARPCRSGHRRRGHQARRLAPLGAAKVTITTATLTGKVNPHGAATTFYFQYGTTTAYGSRTPDAAVGRRHGGRRRHGCDRRASGPNTKYHYRLVAHNSLGTTTGGDRTFTTPKQPLGLALAATPNPVAFGAPSTLAGTLSGTGNAGRPIRLQQKPFPFTTAFANVGNVQLTNAQGAFSFALLSVPLTTQYRVLVTDKASVVSPVLTVNVTVVVGTQDDAHARAPRRARALLRHGAAERGQPPGGHPEAQREEPLGDDLGDDHPQRRRLRQDVRIRRGGSYRVYAGASGGTFAPGRGPQGPHPHELRSARRAPLRRPRAGSA